MKRRRISPRGQRELMGPCWSCDSEGHYKDECPFLWCRFCKKLGHKMAECPIIPEGQRRRITTPVTMEPVRGSGRSRSNPVGIEIHCAQNNSRTVVMTGKKKGERRLPVLPASSNPTVIKARTTNDLKKTNTKQRVFIPKSDQGWPWRPNQGGHDSRPILMGFANHNWIPVRKGNGYLTRFPSAEGLDHTVGRASIPCKGLGAGFSVY